MDLKKDFTEHTLKLTADAEGQNIATLIVSNKNKGNRSAVLYIHGFIDYFFHPHVAEAFHDHKMDFYALDLRKYGRSILPHQTPNYCESLEEYFEEISQAIAEIQKNTDKKIFLLGHSTGCATMALYMNKGEKRNTISGVIMNSPFLEVPQSKALTIAMYRMGKVITKIKPKAELPRNINHVYPQTLHKQFSGEWDFDLTKKPKEAFPAYFKWAIAIVEAQKFLQTRSNITVPVLIMHSDKSSKPKKLNKRAKNSDIILNVSHMKKYGKKLGNQVTFLKVKDGLHDLFLSRKKVRNKALKDMFKWLKKVNK